MWIVLCVIGYSAVNTIIDGRHAIITANGAQAIVTGGRSATVFGLVTLLCATGCALAALVAPGLSRARVLSAVATPILLALIWCAFAGFVRGDGTELVGMAVLQVLMACAVLVSPPTRRTFEHINLIRDLTVVAGLAWSFTHVATATLVCRSDKCGLFGSLFTGIFENENAAGAVVLVLVPAAAVASRGRFWFSLILAAIGIGSTGSRTALAAMAVIAVFLVRHRRDIRNGAPSGRVGFPWRVIPFGALAASFVIFLVITGAQMTGRGDIYGVVKASFRSGMDLIIGPGPQVLVDLLGGWILGAHAEAPQELVVGGIPALALIAFALAQVGFLETWSAPRKLGLAFLLAESCRFVSEASFLLELRTIEAVTVLIIIGLFSAPPGRFRPVDVVTRSEVSTEPARAYALDAR